MKIPKIIAPFLALGLAAAPVAAQAATPIERSSASVVEGSELRSSVLGPAIVIVLIAELGMLALFLADDDDDLDVPVSV